MSVHMLVCRRDVEMACISAMVSNWAFGRALPWVFHDDGSLLDADENLLTRQLPGSRVVRRGEADAEARNRLREYPDILEYRRRQVMALKLVDVRLWGSRERLAYIDSDVLFFGEPSFLMEAIRGDRPGNYFNRDLTDGYVRPAGEIEAETGVRPAPRMNAGLWVMNAAVIDFDRIERWLGHPAFAKNRFDYTLDQTFIAMLAAVSRSGVEHLPPEYDVDLSKPVRGAIEKHYVGAIRHGYELEGLKHLWTESRFDETWEEFVRSAEGSA